MQDKEKQLVIDLLVKLNNGDLLSMLLPAREAKQYCMTLCPNTINPNATGGENRPTLLRAFRTFKTEEEIDNIFEKMVEDITKSVKRKMEDEEGENNNEYPL